MNVYLGVCNAAKKVAVSRPKPLWSAVELAKGRIQRTTRPKAARYSLNEG